MQFDKIAKMINFNPAEKNGKRNYHILPSVTSA